MRKFKLILTAACLCVGFAGLPACEETGFDEAGEEIDEGLEELGDEIEDATDDG